jgi:hypothetical protein
MKVYAMRCGDLILLARQDVRGWSWVLDGPDAKNAASATDENAAKKACINVAKARFRRRRTFMQLRERRKKVAGNGRKWPGFDKCSLLNC